jgi:predicted RNA-binding protein with RPS1 domain
MSRHVIVDGSNMATEGRSKPSLKQLNEAVLAFLAENPRDILTVIVDATFGHRIDPKEVAEFDEAVANNEIVAPPAGTVGRGDAFVLNIAQKVKATVLSNDSYQEFHGEHPWLFDEGRLIGGKPVPNVGWVFVARNPVRGEKSRRAVRDSKRGGKPVTHRRSSEAVGPPPVPKAPPPGKAIKAAKPDPKAALKAGAKAVKAAGKALPKAGAKSAAKSEATSESRPSVETPRGDGRTVNDLVPFLHFVGDHPVGTVVTGVVETYASHGAYVSLGEVRGYVPLRLLGDPPPRAARDVMKIGDRLNLEVVKIEAGRRSIDVKPTDRAPSTKKATAKKPTAKKVVATTKAITKKVATSKAGTKVAAKKPTTKKVATKKAPASKSPAKKVAAKKVATKKVATKKVTAQATKRPAKKSGAKSTK